MTAKQKSFLQVLNSAVKSEDKWHKSPIRLTDGSFWSNWFGWSSSSGKKVTEEKALALSAVWSCVRLISTSVASLPLNIYKRKEDGSRDIARDFSLYDLVHHSPNADMTAYQFWQAFVASMALHGQGYAEIQKSGDRVVALDLILPSEMSLDKDSKGRLIYLRTSSRLHTTETIARDKMFHVPSFTIDGLTGLSAIQFGRNIFGSAMSADDAANSTFKNGLLPTVAFSIDRVLKQEQREEFREYIKSVSGALNAGESPVLEQGIKPETIGINPVDAQLLESRAYSVEEVARWFGVPLWMIGHTDKGSNWGTGLEQQQIAFLTFCLSSYATSIQQWINKKLMTPVDRISYYTEFGFEGFLKADSKTRADYYSIMTQNGIYTRDECRVKENLPRKGGNAEVLTVQTALSPIDAIGRSGLSAVEAIQKAYLGVGKVLTSDEARELINQAGADLTIPGPDFTEQV